ncbi:MAG TPA: hypothetical protein VK169_14370 [Saprospiraceae bacterium]|nr:hypothetical protein [Saprospiraceae bacterium]
MLPLKSDNIYPKNDENLKAIAAFYFDQYDNLDSSGFLDVINNYSSLSLNQIEFISKKISEGYERVFESNLKGTKKIENLFKYAIEAIRLQPNEVKGSLNRIRITNEFRDYLATSECKFDLLDEVKREELAMSYDGRFIIERFHKENNIKIELAQEYFFELQRFLYLCSLSTKKLAPSKELDKIWHTFLLFTKDYKHYCLNHLGKFIDHVPSVTKEDESSNELILSNTIEFYISVFYEDVNYDIWYPEEQYQSECTDIDSDLQSQIDNHNSRSYDESAEFRTKSCVFNGTCYTIGQGCVGENPNDL